MIDTTIKQIGMAENWKDISDYVEKVIAESRTQILVLSLPEQMAHTDYKVIIPAASPSSHFTAK